MPSPVRFSNGVSTGSKGTALFDFPAPDPSKVFSFFDDFNTYTAGQWTVTRVGTTPTEALTDGSFGELLLTISAADNDSDQLQKVGEGFRLDVAGKKNWGKVRFKVSDATQSDFLIGLAVTDTTLLGATAGDGVTDGIFFAKDDGSTSVYFCVQKDTTTGQSTTTSVATMSTSYITLGWYYDGSRYIKLYVNDVHVNTVDLTTTPTTYLPDTELTPSFAMMNGEAVAKTMTVDYLMFAVER